MWSLLLLLICTAAPAWVASQGDRLILKGGDNPCEGYIQIRHDKEWGIVGDDNWNRNNEDVVCKSIGCGTAVHQVDHVYRIRSDIPNIPKKVWINDVSCTGNEKQLWECPNFRGWDVSKYHQDTVRWIKCSGDRLILKGGDNPCEGYIQILHAKEWGIVGDDNWNPNNEDVVCKSIGCGTAVHQVDHVYRMRSDIPNIPKKVWINDVSCTGNEKQLWECPNFRGWDVSKYHQDTVRWIKCSGDRLILKGGDNPCEGYIQILHAKEWGIVGDDNWNPNNEDVVCKSIGCGSAVHQVDHVYRMRSDIPNIPKKVWINDVSCTGNEKQLWECPNFRGWDVSKYHQDTVRWIKCSDTVTYEVEDPQEEYDDVGTVPDITVMTAEVHTVPPPGELMGGEDHTVPPPGELMGGEDHTVPPPGEFMGGEDQDQDYLEPDKEG